MPAAIRSARLQSWCGLALFALVSLLPGLAAAAPSTYSAVANITRPKMVKIYGAGGFRGLEAYQSGFLISDTGHILTAWSYVLDTEFITVVLDDGRRFEQVKLLGADPRLEVAVLKIEATDLPHFDLAAATIAEPGTKVLAFSNLYGVAQGNEPVSVQHGVISVRARLEARRGVFETPYRGEVYVLDAVTNNPGAAGGALTTRRGDLVGMLGKELKNSLNNTWLNYAIPVDQLTKVIESIRNGTHLPVDLTTPEAKPAEAHSTDLLGIDLVPDVLERTPPFVDGVRRNTAAAAAGLHSDDLILFINGRLVQSCKILRSELERLDRAEPLKLTIIRDQELIEMTLQMPMSTPGANP